MKSNGNFILTISYQAGLKKFESDSGMSTFSVSSGSDWALTPPAANTNTRTMLWCNTWKQVQMELVLTDLCNLRQGCVNHCVTRTCILRSTFRDALKTFSSMASHCWKSKLLKASARLWLLWTRKEFMTKLNWRSTTHHITVKCQCKKKYLLVHTGRWEGDGDESE